MRLLLILLLLSPLLCGAIAFAQSVNTPQFDSLAHKVQGLESANAHLKWRLDSLEIVKGQRESLLAAAENKYGQTLTLLQIVLAVAGIVALVVGWFSKRYINRFEKKLKALEETEQRIRDQREKLELAVTNANAAANRIQEFEKAAREAANKIAGTIPDIQQQLEGTKDLRETLKPTLEEYERRISLLESLGGKLTAEDFEKRADSHYFSGRFPEALVELNKALETNQKSVVTWNKKGFVLGKLGRYEEALTAYDAALKIDKGYHLSLYNKACTYAMMSDKPKMLEFLKAAIALGTYYREQAKSDLDFEKYWNDPQFIELVGELHSAEPPTPPTP